jgi:two-component system sensor histidine kinase PilS (NtrC family)
MRAVPGPPRASGTAELFRRVRLQTGFRLLVALLLLGVTAMVQWRGGLSLARFNFVPLYAVIGSVFATSIPAALGLRRIASVRGLELLAGAQFTIDVAITTGLVYLTGGTESPFVFLYLLTIINASAVLFRRGALVTGAASAIAYGLLVDLSYYAVLKPFEPEFLGGQDVSSREALWRIGVTTAGFLMTGLLGSFLAEAYRRTGQELAATSIDLRELQALTKNIVENINSGLLTVDRAARITSFNRSAEEITGRKYSEVFGQPLAQMFPGVAERIARGTLEPRRHEEHLTRPGGERVLGFSYSPLRNDAGREIGTIVIFQDLTELREMESRLKREERLAAVGRLAAGIAHEIRNPLGAISGSIEILKAGLTLGNEDSRLMDIVLRETDRLDGLITEFLDYVKPVKQRLGEVQLGLLLSETRDALLATEAGRGLTVMLPPVDGIAPVKGDPDQLKQVLWNLFLNAAQAMATSKEKRISVRSSVSSLGKLGEVVLLEVEDSGPGIPREEVGRIFEPFYTTKERGTGLGLAMVHKIVEAHGGHIEVESRPEAGALFRIVLARCKES